MDPKSLAESAVVSSTTMNDINLDEAKRICEQPNSTQRMLEAANFYHQKLGWAVHPLHGPKDKNVDPRARGKKPIRKRWQTWTANQVTESLIESWFTDSSGLNIGIVVRPPHVVIDLDSKADDGKSVHQWLAENPGLAEVPRERTTGGAHIHFICHDMPLITKNGKPHGSPLTHKLNDAVTVELYCDGLNIVVAPSVHRSGNIYEWEVTGTIPVFKWAQLQKQFGFQLPDDARTADGKNQPKKPRNWYQRYRGDISTLDLVGAVKEAGLYGQIIDADLGKHSIKCPWVCEHSDGTEQWTSSDFSTAVLIPSDGKSWPVFKCLHAHCAERGLEHLLEFLESKKTGTVDLHCKHMRVWEEGQMSRNGRPRVELPKPGRPHSEFADEVGKLIGPKMVWFLREKLIVVIHEDKAQDGRRAMKFDPMRPPESCTAIEQWVETGIIVKDKDKGDFFSPTSMSETIAKLLLFSPQFRKSVLPIQRILRTQIPMLVDGKTVLPALGYDERLETYTDPGAPKLREMALSEAKDTLRDVFESFMFDEAQSLVNAVARLLTPFCRGIIGFNARTPFWIYTANRERLGKDYLAGVTSILYDGFVNEDAPLEPKNVGETRKRITAAIMAGRQRMHFGNCRGHISDAALEEAITARYWSDRVLGGSIEITLPNEVEFSMSANLGITYTPDIEHRSRRIGLFYEGENPNGRKFARPDLHSWIYENRPAILSAIHTLFNHWQSSGSPAGPTPFASYPEWTTVVGGIMHASGLGDPCATHKKSASFGGDEETAQMTLLFESCHAKLGAKMVESSGIREIAEGNGVDRLFPWIDLQDRPGQTIFGKLFRRFVGRSLGGIFLRENLNDKRRPKYHFEKKSPDDVQGEGNLVHEFFGPSASPNVDIVNIVNLSNPVIGQNPTPFENGNDRSVCTVSIGGGISPDNVDNVDIFPQRVSVTDAHELPGIAQILRSSNEPVALDIETSGSNALDPFLGKIRLLTLAVPGHPVWIIDLVGVGSDLGLLKEALEAAQIIGHNLAFDAFWLRVHYKIRLPNLFCTMTASRILTRGTDEKNDLGECLRRHLNIDLPKDQGRSDWGAVSLTEAQVSYAHQDVAHLHQLKAKMVSELDAADLRAVFQNEMGLLPVVIEMQEAGFAVNREALATLRSQAEAKAKAAEAEFRAFAGEPTLNLASPVQVKEALHSAGLMVAATDVETLASISHPLVNALLGHREAVKRLQQAATLEAAVRGDGRIHGCFNPMGTETGRFSSSKPNLQNIPREGFRACFVASPDCVLIIADYSQIELRAAAAIAGEVKMLEAYRNGADLHSQTASVVLGKPLEEVTKEDRQLAKAVNFGLLYGQRAKGLSAYAKSNYGIDLTLPKAEELHRKFFSAYPALARWHELAWRDARRGCKEVRTRTGRRRLLLGGRDNEWKRFTALVNTPVQGGCADGLKRAMIDLASRAGGGVRIVSTVHDELIVEAPREQAEAVKILVEECMKNAMATIFPEVPIVVQAKVAENWGGK